MNKTISLVFSLQSYDSENGKVKGKGIKKQKKGVAR